MTGYSDIIRLRRIEKELDELGFIMCQPRHGWNDSDRNYVAIKPKDQESLPIYSRDAELFSGTLEDLNVWIRGVEWARGYDMLLRVSDDKKRARKEQDERNRQMVKRLRDEEVITRKK